MKFGNRIEVDPDKLRINEEVVDYTAFGTSRYAKCISRATNELIKMGYCIAEEDKNMNDLEKLRTLNNEYGISTSVHRRTRKSITIKDVIFNDPATIVFWKDGTKTVVKCQKDKGDTYNPELGLAMCIIKKMCDNKGNYNDVFNKWLPKESE